MKLLRPSQTVLVAQEKNSNQWWSLIFLLLFIVFGLALVSVNLIGWLFVLVGIIFGGVIFFTHQAVTATFDKSASQLTLQIKKFRSNRTINYRLDQIAKVQLYSGIQRMGGFNSNNMGPTASSTLLLLLTDGTTITLSTKQRSSVDIQGVPLGGIIGSLPNLKNGQAIAAFLGVPFEQNGAGNPLQAIGNLFHPSPNSDAMNTTQPNSMMSVEPSPAPTRPDGPGFALPNHSDQSAGPQEPQSNDDN